MARYSGPSLVLYVPGGKVSEPLREDVCSQVRRLVDVVSALPPGDVTWQMDEDATDPKPPTPTEEP